MSNILEDCRTTLNRCVSEEVGLPLRCLAAELVGDIEKEQEKKLFLVYHHHRFGHSTFIIKSNECPSLEQAIEVCEIDFEPEREEWIDIDEVTPIDIS